MEREIKTKARSIGYSTICMECDITFSSTTLSIYARNTYPGICKHCIFKKVDTDAYKGMTDEIRRFLYEG